jgi:hypothetical protein
VLRFDGKTFAWRIQQFGTSLEGRTSLGQKQLRDGNFFPTIVVEAVLEQWSWTSSLDTQRKWLQKPEGNFTGKNVKKRKKNKANAVRWK